jgi:hypothetical protein
MSTYEIIFIILIVAFVGGVFGREIYRYIKRKPSKSCQACMLKSARTLAEIRKMLAQEKNSEEN